MGDSKRGTPHKPTDKETGHTSQPPEGEQENEQERVPEQWVPVTSAGQEPPPQQWIPQTAGPTDRPDEVFRQFFEMQKIPEDAEVMVAPSMRAALDTPFKVILVLLLIFGPFTATGFAMGGPYELIPLGGLLVLWNYWPFLVFAFAPAIRLMFTRYVVDAEGIRSRTQVLSVTESRISWDKVTAIQYRRTLMDRVLGLERLSIIAYGERGATLRLVGLRNAKELRNLTAQKMREHATAEAIFSND